MPVKNRFAEMLPEITAWRRDFHAHPELLYEVHRTAGKVAGLLRDFGCDEVVEGVGRSGVVGVIHGRNHGSGRVVGLRADMDALPITELTGLDYASTTPGVMHACGHDGHTAMLLGAARYLAETRNFDGTAVLIFQPAEEGGAGGKAMLDDGLLTRFGIEEVYGLHNTPGIPVGAFGIRPGAIMASADTFEITIAGKGGHAARPHMGIDPMLVAAHVTIALQSIVSRNVDPFASAVLSVCTMQGDSPATNVIPGKVTMGGTVRTMDPEVRLMIEARLKAVACATADAFGALAEVDWKPGYPVTVNDPAATEHAVAVATEVAGSFAVDAATPAMMAAEDFSYMLEARPGAYIFLGNGDSAGLHNAGYVFDDEALPFGASWYAGMVEARMPA